jgi:hypothetical protein
MRPFASETCLTLNPAPQMGGSARGRPRSLFRLDVRRGRLPGAAIDLNVKRNLLAFDESRMPDRASAET